MSKGFWWVLPAVYFYVFKQITLNTKSWSTIGYKFYWCCRHTAAWASFVDVSQVFALLYSTACRLWMLHYSTAADCKTRTNDRTEYENIDSSSCSVWKGVLGETILIEQDKYIFKETPIAVVQNINSGAPSRLTHLRLVGCSWCVTKFPPHSTYLSPTLLWPHLSH